MNKINKLGFIIVGHQSPKYSPHGNRFTKKCIDSILNLQHPDIHISYIDNQSSEKFYPHIEYKDKCEFSYKYVDNQFKNDGISGAWEDGTRLSIENNCDLIINTNYDTEFNPSLFQFIKDIEGDIEQDISVYGPLTNEPGFQSRQKSESFVSKNNSVPFTSLQSNDIDALNGFCFIYTPNFARKFSINGKLFGKQAFDKSEFIQRTWKNNGAKIKISQNLFVYHDKQGSWRKLYQ